MHVDDPKIPHSFCNQTWVSLFWSFLQVIGSVNKGIRFPGLTENHMRQLPQKHSRSGLQNDVNALNHPTPRWRHRPQAIFHRWQSKNIEACSTWTHPWLGHCTQDEGRYDTGALTHAITRSRTPLNTLSLDATVVNTGTWRCHLGAQYSCWRRQCYTTKCLSITELRLPWCQLRCARTPHPPSRGRAPWHFPLPSQNGASNCPHYCCFTQTHRFTTISDLHRTRGPRCSYLQLALSLAFRHNHLASQLDRYTDTHVNE